MNNCNFAGNLTDDIKIVKVDCKDGTPKSKAIIKLAVKNSHGTTTFIEFTVWGAQAENAAKFLKKGSAVAIIAEAENNTYEKDGIKVYTYQFTAKEITYLSSAKTENN